MLELYQTSGAPGRTRPRVLLPCNVVVYERAGVTHTSAIDPERMLSIVANDELALVAADVKSRLGASSGRAVAG